MLNKRDYSIEDLLLDDSFVHYCLDTRPEAVAAWEEWLAENPDQSVKLEAARKMLFSLGIRLSPEEKEEQFAQLKAAVEAMRNGGARQEPEKRLRPVAGFFRWAAGIAAAVLLIATGFYWHKLTAPVTEQAGVLAYERYNTGDGERKRIELADGSAVILNSNSSLRIPASYNRKDRQLELEGEALFEVAKDAARPFTVHNNQLDVQALGTVFKVRAYGFEPAIRTALLEGKVKLDDRRTKRPSRFLAPGEWLQVAGADRSVEAGTFDLEEERLWQEGRLIFRDASLEEIGRKLQYWYGMEVRLQAHPGKAVHFNGEFMNRSLEEVLKAIAYVNNLRCSINNQQITILDR